MLQFVLFTLHQALSVSVYTATYIARGIINRYNCSFSNSHQLQADLLFQLTLQPKHYVH